ncbi:MAG: hypothetical protein AAGK21_17160, partial [Bacteroidota bacterium]
AALSVLASTCGALVIWTVFEVRQEHIAEHHCENPLSDCDGICFLDKRMHDHHGHDHDRPHTPAVVPTAPTLTAVPPVASAVPPDRWRTAPAPETWDARDPSAGALGDVFRPPRG